jgi:microcystin-dependent protein
LQPQSLKLFIMNRACKTSYTTDPQIGGATQLNWNEQNQHASCIRPFKNNFVRMKKYYFSIIALIIAISALAQSPYSFKYQAVLRDGSGNPKVNQSVNVGVSLLLNSASGSVAYSESFATSTNAYGIVNLNIGQGTGITGSISNIKWSSNTVFIKITVDGTEISTSQLLSVPYALYADKAGNGFSGNYNDLTNKPAFTNWDKDSTDNINKPADATSGDLLTYDGNNWVAKRIVNGYTGVTGGSQSFSIRDPYLALNYQIAIYGIFPSRNMSSDPYIASIGIFAGNFEVKGWAMCNGQLLSIANNQALFALIGTYYGGDGQTTFGLPDLRGRVPIHFGQGPGLSNIGLAETGGNETQTISIQNMPAHNHSFTITYE